MPLAEGVRGERIRDYGAGGRMDEQKERTDRRASDREEASAASAGRKDGVERKHRHGRQALALGLAAASLGGVAATTAGGGASSATPAKPQAPKPEPERQEASARQETWDLPTTKNDRVDFFIEFLMGKNRDKTATWLNRIGRYGPMIQEKLADAGMPRDLLYLSMIESGLDPNAYSSADAAGLWQFIAPTGERYGLEVSKYVDERRDPVKATDAAVAYLKDLNQRFKGSWYLSAAGYNTGENRVERVLREHYGTVRGDENQFWEIMPDLPQETRDYVPVMLAMGYIAKNPAKYGFTEVQPEKPLSFAEVTVPGGTDLADVARAAGVDAGTVIDLNPQLVKKQTPPNRSWSVRVPVGTQERVAMAYASSAAQAGYHAVD